VWGARSQYFAKMFEPVLRRANHRFPFALFALSREISARGDRASREAAKSAKSSFRALRTHVEASREAASLLAVKISEVLDPGTFVRVSVEPVRGGGVRLRGVARR
jgi:hypothetical protein